MRNIGRIKDAASLLAYFKSLDLKLPFDEDVRTGPDSPLSQPLTLYGKTIGNRFAILPMEGWDCTADGRPTDLTRRRWQRWGLSGAKLIFGAEAIAVCPEGRGSPSQLIMAEETLSDIAGLRELLVTRMRSTSRRSTTSPWAFSSPTPGASPTRTIWAGCEPRTLYHHPLLDGPYDARDDSAVMSDAEVERVVADFVKAAVLAQRAGFDFVDIKHCHGYLGHEFLSAVDRPGKYGGSFENRTRFLREIVTGIRNEAPGLDLAVRFSAVDFVPFEDGDDDRARPVGTGGAAYPYAFGGDGTGLGTDLTEPLAFLDVLAELGIELVSRVGRRRVQLARHGTLRLAARRAAPPARGPADRRRPAAVGRGDDEKGAPRAGAHRQRLLLPASLAAQRRPGRRETGLGRHRRHRPHGV